VEDSSPSVIYLALKYHHDPEQGLGANTNLGGYNAHRGMVLGVLLGAKQRLRSISGTIDQETANPPADLQVIHHGVTREIL
jgi:hypothetical protein